jgi:chromosome partitioning protein
VAKVFSIANQKGGVGKTTTTVNLGAGLARLGIPTLIVDLDAQANATSALGIEKTEGKSLYKVLHGEAKAADMIVATSTEKLDLIPSEVDLAAVESELAQAGITSAASAKPSRRSSPPANTRPSSSIARPRSACFR